MFSDFDYAFKTIISHEGNYVNNPNDRGGETKYGISKRSYPNEDIKNLTLRKAKKIYKRDFWVASGAPLMPTKELKILMFDIGVNHGTSRARKMLQESLNLLNHNQELFNDLVVDGVIGKNTRFAISKIKKPHYLLLTIVAKRMEFFTTIADGSNQEAFIRGWLSRASSFV